MAIGLLLLCKMVKSGSFRFIIIKIKGESTTKKGQKAQASLGIMDSQSVRWGNNRSLNGFDGGKKVKGIKRHIVVDKNGFLLAVMVSVANIHDSKAALLLMKTLQYLLIPLQVILADGGYRGDIIEEIRMKFGYIIQIVMRNNKKENKFEPIHKRWIIERTFSWFDNDRRLCRNYELLMESAENIVKLSAIKLLLNKI
ncbi:transposase [Chryseobacterium sp. G0201]|uniref:transposase n=1 Tax=Chryseobacterium sp. G0201 TaxID=2487065 RepID=UPI001E587FD7|nr:transposase [Chryseobacterium sp. G0201]